MQRIVSVLIPLGLMFGLSAGVQADAQSEVEAKIDRIDKALENDEVVEQLSASEREHVELLRIEGREHYMAQDRGYANQALDQAKEILDLS